MAQRGEKISESLTQGRRSGPGRRRLWLALLFAFAASALIVCAGALWALNNLDHPFVKGRVEGVLSNLLGTEVRYKGLSLSPTSGLHLQGLIVATPDSLREHAPEMLRLEELRIPIEFRTLLSGHFVVPEVHGGPVEATVVITDDGRNSFAELLESEGDLQQAFPPFSKSLEVLDELSFVVGPIELGPIRLSSIEVTSDGARVRQRSLEPLGFFSEGVSFEGDARGSASLRPYERDDVVLSVIDLANDGSVREARLDPTLDLRLTSSRTIELTAEARLRDQSLFPELRPVASIVQLDASAHFDPDQAQTTFYIDSLTAFDSMLVANARLVLDDAPQPEGAPPTVPFDKATLDARGTLDVAALPWELPWLAVRNFNGRFDLEGIEIEQTGLAAGAFRVKGDLDQVRYEDGPLTVELRNASLDTVLDSPDSPTKMLGTLRLDASVAHVGVEEQGGFTGAVEKLGTSVELRGVGKHDSGMWGLRGKGTLNGSMERVSGKAPGVTAVSKGALALDIDLAEHRVEGSVPIEFLALRQAGSAPIQVRGAELGLIAREPMHWTSDEGAPSVDLSGSVERVTMGKRHFRAPRWSLGAKRIDPDRYALDALLTADRVSWGRFPNAPKSALELEALIDAARPAIDADAALSIAGRAATRLSLQASQDGSTTRYAVDLAGMDAGPLLGALVFGDGGHRSDELSFAFESRGKFRGLLSKDDSGALVPSRRPFRTARGEHRSVLRVNELALVRSEITHELRGLSFDASSSHESPGRGALEANLSVDEVRFGQSERPMELHDYAHELDAAYAALHGAPSFTLKTDGTFDHLDQWFVRQYPIRNVSFGAELDADDTQVFAVRHAYLHNSAGGTKFEARGAYEGWRDAIRATEVCNAGTRGCPEVASMYGREAATVTGTFEQDFSFWQSTERVKSGGSIRVPFTVESGDLATYRILARTEIRDVMLELPEYGLRVDDLDASIPIDQEFGTAPTFFMVPATVDNTIAQKRFFDLYPFTTRDSFLSVDQVQLGREVIGPVAANLHIAGSTLAMDQLHAAYRGGFVTGQFRADLSDDDPKVLFRGHLTGVRVEDSDDVLDANLAMSFVPTTLIVEGKAQIVRVSKDHLYEIIDVLDPYHEDEDLNRVRLGLKFGYPKFVLIKLDEGLMNAKIDLGGLAGAVRIDEIKGIPVTPFLEQYVQPYIERILSPSLSYDAAPAEPEAPPKVSQASESRP
jgi:translocation and assembly module TamB